MEPKFYIGQKVVAITTHSDGDFKKGDIFTILHIKKGCCFWEVKINNDFQEYEMICVSCNSSEISTPYFYEHNFSPIQEQQISEITYEDAIDLVTEKIIIS